MCDSTAIRNMLFAALFHDIGKVFHYYDDLIKNFRIKYPHGHWHAYAGRELLNQLSFPEEITALVEQSHNGRAVRGTLPYSIQIADHVDAKMGRKEKKESAAYPVTVFKTIHLRVRSLHGGDPYDILRKGLAKENIEKCVAILKETLSLLRADQQVEDVSLYIHSLLVPAIAACHHMSQPPVLMVIENDIDERAKSATVESVEYLCGLQLYAYFGLLAALAKTFCGKDSILLPISVVSESPLLFVTLIPESYVEPCLSNLKQLANDLKTVLRATLRKIGIPDGEISKPIIHEFRQSYASLFSSGMSCAYCREPMSLGDEVNWFGNKICFNCYEVARAYQYLKKDAIVSLIEGKYEHGLVYRNLDASLLLGVSENAIARRLLNPSSHESVLQEGLIPTDLLIDRFDKTFRFWVLLDTTRLIDASLDAEENKLHKYVTRSLMVPIELRRLISETVRGRHVLVKCDPTSTVAQVFGEVDALRLAFASINEHIDSVIVRATSPGMTYKKLFAKASASRTHSEPFIYLDYVDCLILEGDNRRAREVIRSFKSLGLPLKKLEVVLDQVIISLDRFRGHGAPEQDRLDKVLLRSELLLKIGPLARAPLSGGLPMASEGYGRVFVEEMTELLKNDPAKLCSLISTMRYLLRSELGG